ncbi:MAG: hypothetical protein Crog3KO_25050 [Crocinitomicaceae bacterium]
MKIKNEGTWNSCTNRVIVVAENMDVTAFSDREQELIKRFQEQDKELVKITDFETNLIFVKQNSEAEKMRMQGAAVRSAVDTEVTEIAIKGDASSVVPLTEGLLLANYQFLKYFKKEDREKKTNKLTSIELESSVSAESCEELLSIYKAVSWSRTMVNEPVSYLNAEQFAEEMKALADDAPMEVSVLEKTQLESLKMGGILAVNQGSIDPPTFTILEYKPENAKNEKPIVLVGKGVVYDTGGLSLKPTPNSMDLMKIDMGGAACVAGAIYLAALQKLPVHIITLVPATDNRPGLNAYAPGDVVTMYDGTTVEVRNTDAEGRMILADALAYSNKYNPELVIDAATLTGAAVRAIGDFASCVMGNADEKYFQGLDKAANATHERLARFPFWDEYLEEMKSPIADLNNLGGPYAGMITAGKFLEHFTKSPYIHLDLGNPVYRASDNGYRVKGGTGVGVRMLYHFLKNYE